jgi:hypothetical protein
MKYSIVVSDISITTDENDIKRDLMQRYDGVKSVSRWYFDDDEEYPMSCVQIDFDSRKNMDIVLEKGNIVIGGICRRVSIIRQPQCYRCQQTGHKTSDCDSEPLTQQDLLNIFEEQKR